MRSIPNIGNLPLNQQSSLVQTMTTSSQFTLGSLGMFYPRSGVIPPFSSGNTNLKPNSSSSIGFLFRWNWNSTTPHGQQNFGLAYIGLSLQMLGNNPSLDNVRGNPHLGMQSGGNQGIPTPQHNVGFNPYSTQ